MAFDIGGLLQQYLGRSGSQPEPDAPHHYDQVAQNASPQAVSQGLADAFRSNDTPPFGELVGQLFRQATPEQRAGMLGTLLSALGPSAASILERSGIQGVLGAASSTTTAVSPQQASQVTPAQVQQIAEHAEASNPGVVDRLSAFYAQHPQLVKTLGTAALTIALAKIANVMKR